MLESRLLHITLSHSGHFFRLNILRIMFCPKNKIAFMINIITSNVKGNVPHGNICIESNVVAESKISIPVDI